MKKNKSGFLTIEVLISLIIIFISIVTLSSSIKVNRQFDNKKDIYTDLYTTVKSVHNYLKKSDLKLKTTKSYSKIELPFTVLNGFNIIARVKDIKSLRNYVYNPDIPQLSGNVGDHRFTLYEIILTVSKKSYSKEFKFYLTKMIK